MDSFVSFAGFALLLLFLILRSKLFPAVAQMANNCFIQNIHSTKCNFYNFFYEMSILRILNSMKWFFLRTIQSTKWNSTEKLRSRWKDGRIWKGRRINDSWLVDVIKNILGLGWSNTLIVADNALDYMTIRRLTFSLTIWNNLNQRWRSRIATSNRLMNLNIKFSKTLAT